MKWIGNGVLLAGDKIIKAGEDIPADALTKERIAEFKKEGKIGESEPEKKESAKLKKLKVELKEAEEYLLTLAEGADGRDELVKKIDELKALITDEESK